MSETTTRLAFEIEDQVRVKAGVVHPDYPDIPLGGWAGTIVDVDPNDPRWPYQVEWFDEVLDQVHPVYPERCHRDDLYDVVTWLGAEALEAYEGEPITVEDPKLPPFGEHAGTAQIREIFGVESGEDLPVLTRENLLVYDRFLVEHLALPFEGEVEAEMFESYEDESDIDDSDFDESDIDETDEEAWDDDEADEGEWNPDESIGSGWSDAYGGPTDDADEDDSVKVTVVALRDPATVDEVENGILCEVLRDGVSHELPLGQVFVENSSPNSELLADYSFWLYDVNSDWSDEEDEWDQEDAYGEEDDEGWKRFWPGAMDLLGRADLLGGLPIDGQRQGLGSFSHSGPVDTPEHIVARPKVGRNDPCPCGSGKKYKKCCLKQDL